MRKRKFALNKFVIVATIITVACVSHAHIGTHTRWFIQIISKQFVYINHSLSFDGYFQPRNRRRKHAHFSCLRFEKSICTLVCRRARRKNIVDKQNLSSFHLLEHACKRTFEVQCPIFAFELFLLGRAFDFDKCGKDGGHPAFCPLRLQEARLG